MTATHAYDLSKAYANSIGANLQVWLLPQNNYSAGTGMKLSPAATAAELERGLRAQVQALETELGNGIKVTGILVEKEVTYDTQLRTSADTVLAVVKAPWSSLQYLDVGYAEKSFGHLFSKPVKSFAQPSDPLPLTEHAAQAGSGPGVLPTFAWPDSYEPAYPKAGWTGLTNELNSRTKKFHASSSCNSGVSACQRGCGCIIPHSYGKQVGHSFADRTSKSASPINIAVLGGPGANVAAQGSCGNTAIYAKGAAPVGCSDPTDFSTLYNAAQGLLSSTLYQNYLNLPGMAHALALYG
jgi:hypothetical protein